jgi:hypothetical protein
MIHKLLPNGYDRKTKCCVRCAKMVDHSHPDGYELYCGADGVKEPPYPTSDELKNSPEYDRLARIWFEWSVPRQVEPWATCPLFGLSQKRVEYESRLEESEQYDPDPLLM